MMESPAPSPRGLPRAGEEDGSGVFVCSGNSLGSVSEHKRSVHSCGILG